MRFTAVICSTLLDKAQKQQGTLRADVTGHLCLVQSVLESEASRLPPALASKNSPIPTHTPVRFPCGHLTSPESFCCLLTSPAVLQEMLCSHTQPSWEHLFLQLAHGSIFSCALSETSWCFLDAASWFYLFSVYDLSCQCLWPSHDCPSTENITHPNSVLRNHLDWSLLFFFLTRQGLS